MRLSIISRIIQTVVTLTSVLKHGASHILWFFIHLLQATDNIEWATDNFAAMQETCKKSIYKNVSFYENSTDGELKLNTKFIASLCPNDCSNHGNCSNATCTCDEYYTASDCSISLRDRPYVAGIRKDGLCDVRRRPCRNVGIYGFPFLDSANLTCHVQEFKVYWTVILYITTLCEVTVLQPIAECIKQIYSAKMYSLEVLLLVKFNH